MSLDNIPAHAHYVHAKGVRILARSAIYHKNLHMI
jgi:hypothetical protein